MPFEIEKDGATITVWTQDEVETEVKGLKVTNENLKTEKAEIAQKLTDQKEVARQLEEAKAKAEGDNETLKRLADEREADKQREIDEAKKRMNDLVTMTKQEKVNNALSEVVNKIGAGGKLNNDLRDLLKSRFSFDYDIDTSSIKVSGNGVSDIEQLEKLVKTSGDYSVYLAGSGASGGGSTGSSTSGAGSPKTTADIFYSK